MKRLVADIDRLERRIAEVAEMNKRTAEGIERLEQRLMSEPAGLHVYPTGHLHIHTTYDSPLFTIWSADGTMKGSYSQRGEWIPGGKP